MAIDRTTLYIACHCEERSNRKGVGLLRSARNDRITLPFVEMAIASFLDAEALGFADCQPERGQ